MSEAAIYTLWDAAAIVLREGGEALLIILSLLTLLSKSGHPQQRRWIWLGAIIGLGAALVTAVLLQLLLQQLPLDPEILEGTTALLAAVLLVYVSYWLHQQASLGSWKEYIHHQVTAALDSNRILSIALIAFLAVYREGAETLLFFLGIAPAIQTQTLLLGAGLGIGLLILVAVILLQVGGRLPLRPFFRVTSLLIYGLGFKLLGNGVHAFQEANLLPLHSSSLLPHVRILGIYPTWETCLFQGGVLVVGILMGITWWQRQTRVEQGAPPLTGKGEG
jgi:high-affinity iron transporter